jgi:hypothetical protein
LSVRKVYQDRSATCSECQAPFTITAREHMFAETMGYRMPKRCLKCRRNGKTKKKGAEKIGTSVREMFEAGEFSRLFGSQPSNGEVAPAPEAPEPDALDTPPTPEELRPGTPEENVAALRKYFVGPVVPISPDQPECSIEDIKVLMTRANQMRWPDDGHQCRKQNCDLNGHIHPRFKTDDGKSIIRSLYGNIESSKELRKPQIDFLYESFGKVLSGAAFLDRDGQGTVYIATPPGETEEEVRASVLKYV